MLKWLTMANGSDNDYVTKSTLNEAIDAILEGMGKMFGEMRSDMGQMGRDINSRFDLLEAKINQTKNELKDEIDGLKADLSTTPSREEFEELKQRVDKQYPRLS
jgi:hypothetical protein